MPTEQDEQKIPGQIVYVMPPALGGDAQESDLMRMLQAAWQRRWWIAACTALATIVGIVYVMLATPVYYAESVLMPRDVKSGSGLSAQLGQLGGLADLAGISIGSANTQEPLGMLRSRGFARRFIERNKLTDVLAQAAGSEQPADIRRAEQIFMRRVMSVGDDKKSGLVSIGVSWHDPVAAADWANKLADQLNEEMRLRALNEAEANIRYLHGQLASTATISLQQSISRLIESEMQKVMLARGTDEYAFRVIDVADPPLQKSKPKALLVITAAFLAGLIFSIIFAVAASAVKQALGAARNGRGHAGLS